MVLVVRGAAQVVRVAAGGQAVRRGAALRDADVLPGGVLVLRDGLIYWVGPEADLPPLPPDAAVLDAAGGVVLPGFVDSHTHLVFAGSREDEFEQRLGGLSYQTAKVTRSGPGP